MFRALIVSLGYLWYGQKTTEKDEKGLVRTQKD